MSKGGGGSSGLNKVMQSMDEMSYGMTSQIHMLSELSLSLKELSTKFKSMKEVGSNETMEVEHDFREKKAR